MKRIEAIVRNEKMNDVKTALEKLGVYGMHTMEVKGRGTQRGITQQWKGAVYVVDMIPKVKLVLTVKDADKEKVVDAIVKAARTGNIGDGKIFVTPVEEVIRVRTGEKGDAAL
ncbi:MAG: P-II family nitrogen regulator [Euryarchaeota archaeon]|nr:P-II family nitrogen regulator [Euryarchaeota archaeon]